MFDLRSQQPMPPAAVMLSAVEFLTIELAPMADGSVRVSLTATTIDDDEPELLDREVAHDHVRSLDDVLSLIRTHVLISPAPLAPFGAR